MNHALLAVLLVAAIAAGWWTWEFGRRLWRRHLTAEGIEFAVGHQKLIRRQAGLTIKDRDCREAVVPAETMRYGWVWIRVCARAPHPGERPIEAHDTQMGWALTRRGAQRKMRKTPPPMSNGGQRPVLA